MYLCTPVVRRILGIKQTSGSRQYISFKVLPNQSAHSESIDRTGPTWFLSQSALANFTHNHVYKLVHVTCRVLWVEVGSLMTKIRSLFRHFSSYYYSATADFQERCLVVLLARCEPQEVRGIALRQEVRGIALPQEVRGIALPQEVRGIELPQEVRGVALLQEVRGVALPQEV